MTDLLLILGVAFFCFLFWQQRRQSENAQLYIKQRCQQLDLQLLSVARGEHSIGWPKGPLSIETRYFFEFSVNGADNYEGYALMAGLRLKNVYIPPHPMPEGR
ncbi:hypothetical protein CS022_15120 [Veronia nyctiphanis]|uniref:DUF3301 domain-containing protein n=1 Tax=Veronia nyctiphanis TaxID=1278244 RepID=A0A4Q0YNJ7_9GAMM|nr:DUF3301 domain-containing protein [Veronia nyctiphanis]RXJ72517.1 hypothetical protein CS022_15120 [Veronia nyctiphanis]